MKHKLIEIVRIVLSPNTFDTPEWYFCRVYFSLKNEEYRKALIRYVNYGYDYESATTLAPIYLKRSASYPYGGLNMGFEEGCNRQEHRREENEMVNFCFQIDIKIESTKMTEVLNAVQRLEDYFVKFGSNEKQWRSE